MPGMWVLMNSKELATAYRAALDAWMNTGSAESADDLCEIENEVIGHLDIDPDETEQGLTPKATAIIDAFLVAQGV